EVAIESTWDPSAGPVLVVPGATPQEAVGVIPRYVDGVSLDTVHFDTKSLVGSEIGLFARGRGIGEVKGSSASGPNTEHECTAWPGAELAAPSGAPITSWTVGFANGRATAIPIDSLEAVSRSDSSRIVADIARLASSLPGDTSQAFRGLPFVVRSVRRF